MSRISDKIEERGKLLLGYLPAIYRMDAESEAFLEKYLGIFGYEIINMEEMIADIPRYFDPKALTADEEDFLRWLTGWLSLDLFSQYASLNRDYMLKASQFYRIKGTEAGVIDLLEFFSDGKVCAKDKSTLIFRTYCKDLLDEYHTESYTLDTDDQELLDSMGEYDDTVHYIYGGDTYVIDAYLAALQSITDPDELELKKQILKKLVEPFVPAAWKVQIKVMNEAGTTLQKLIGNDDKSWELGGMIKDVLGFQKFIAVAGTLAEIRIKCGGNGHAQVAIYSDNAGHPGAVLAYAMGATVAFGWNTIPLNTTVNLSATNYWLAYIYDTNALLYRLPTGGVGKYKILAYGNPFPDSPMGLSDSTTDRAIAGWGFRL
jgi:phage tail-like protein